MSKKRAPAKIRICAYCDVPADCRITSEQGRAIDICEAHEERAIIELRRAAGEPIDG